ncbi:MAG: alpha/beta hydrolase family protein, partial [Alphaproteobacteria bacterium]
HGFPGQKTAHNDLFGEIEFILGDKGFHILRFDYRGCGESDGKEEDFTIGSACEDFQTMLYWAKSKGYERFIYVGEGIGAALSIMNTDLDVIGLIMLWPVLDLDVYRKSAFGISKISQSELDKGYVEHKKRRLGVTFLKELRKMDLGYAIRDVRMPTLILHGTQDAIVPISQLDVARAQMNSKRLEITSFHDGEHGLPDYKHRKAMIFQIQQFVEKYI